MAHTIDKINVHEDDPGLLYWFVHGKRMGPVRRDYAAKLGIEVGALWSKTLARKVEHVAQLNACHAAALAFLAKRDFTSALLLERLCRKWPEAIAQVTVDQMRAACGKSRKLEGFGSAQLGCASDRRSARTSASETYVLGTFALEWNRCARWKNFSHGRGFAVSVKQCWSRRNRRRG